jgi:hypothetical protein
VGFSETAMMSFQKSVKQNNALFSFYLRLNLVPGFIDNRFADIAICDNNGNIYQRSLPYNQAFICLKITPHGQGQKP